jgi:hypothetical protein
MIGLLDQGDKKKIDDWLRMARATSSCNKPVLQDAFREAIPRMAAIIGLQELKFLNDIVSVAHALRLALDAIAKENNWNTDDLVAFMDRIHLESSTEDSNGIEEKIKDMFIANSVLLRDGEGDVSKL